MTTDPGATPLAVVRGTGPGTDGAAPLPAPVPPDGTAPGTPVPAAVGTPVRLTAAERAGTAARHAVDGTKGIARELWTGPGRLVHSVVHGEADTMKGHWARVQSRSWVPEEMTGRPAEALALAGIIHHLLVAYPVKALAKALEFATAKLDHAADRAITLYGLIAFVVLLTVLLIHL